MSHKNGPNFLILKYISDYVSNFSAEHYQFSVNNDILCLASWEFEVNFYKFSEFPNYY